MLIHCPRLGYFTWVIMTQTTYPLFLFSGKVATYTQCTCLLLQQVQAISSVGIGSIIIVLPHRWIDS